MTPILGIDISEYQSKYGKQLDFSTVPSSVSNFIIIKATQGNYSKDLYLDYHYKGAKSIGAVTGFYMWADPMVGAKQQADYYLKNTSPYKRSFTAVDMEQEWADWTEYWNFLRTGKRYTKIISSNQISDIYNQLCTILESEGEKIVPYTRASFVWQYSRQMTTWLKKYPIRWYAQYLYALENMDVKRMMGVNFSSYKLWFPPGWPEELKSYKFWQFSSTAKIEGILGNVDTNYFNGSAEELITLSPGQESEGGIPDYRLARVYNCKFLFVRKAPSMLNIPLRYLSSGDVVKVYSVTNGWAKISKDSEEYCGNGYLQYL